MKLTTFIAIAFAASALAQAPARQGAPARSGSAPVQRGGATQGRGAVPRGGTEQNTGAAAVTPDAQRIQNRTLMSPVGFKAQVIKSSATPFYRLETIRITPSPIPGPDFIDVDAYVYNYETAFLPVAAAPTPAVRVAEAISLIAVSTEAFKQVHPELRDCRFSRDTDLHGIWIQCGRVERK